MAVDFRPQLSALSEDRLRSLASVHHLSVDACRSKDDLVELLARNGVAPEMDPVRLEILLGARKASELREIAARHGVDVAKLRKRTEIAAALSGSPAAAGIWTEVVPPAAGPALPSMEDAEVDVLLYAAKNSDVDFGRAEDLLEQARMRFEERNFEQAIAAADEAAALAGAAEETSRRSAWAYAIISCQRLVEDCGRSGRDVEAAADLVREAKRAFRDDRLRTEPELLHRLEEIARNLYSEEIQRARDGVVATSAVLERAEAIGANLAYAEEALGRARDALRRGDPLLCIQQLAYAEKLAQEAVAVRMQDIEEGLQGTATTIGEARNVGADVAEAERLLDQARAAFGEKEFVLAGELLKRSERAAMQSQQAQIEKAIELRRRQVDKAKAILGAVEPVIAEAESFGVDTSEVRVLVQQALDVLAEGDYVNGTLFARNVTQAVRALEPRLIDERAKRGIVKPTSGVCGNCGSRRLAFHDDGWGQCLECGKAFRWNTSWGIWRRFRQILRE